MSTSLKYWFNIGNFFDTIRPNIRVLRLFGVFPFSITRTAAVTDRTSARTKTLRVEVKFMDIVLFTVWQIVFLQMLYASWTKAFLEMPMSRIMIMVTLLLYLIGGLNCSISSVLVLAFRKRFLRMVELVEETDHLFYKCSAAIQHSKIHLVCVAFLLGAFFFQVLLFLNEYVAGKQFANYISSPWSKSMEVAFIYYYVIRTVHVTCVTAFIGGLYGFRERLLTLNKQLRVCFLEMPSADPVPSYGELMCRIQGFIEIYSNLCDAIRLYCSIFVWQPTFFCASLIVATVFAILSIGHIFTYSVPLVLAMVMIYTMVSTLYSVLFLLLVKLGNDLKRELVLFSHHIQHQRPVVSCGLFCFDWTLALSIISAIATYSVILIQFELGVPKFFISGILQHSTDTSANNP